VGWWRGFAATVHASSTSPLAVLLLANSPLASLHKKWWVRCSLPSRTLKQDSQKSSKRRLARALEGVCGFKLAAASKAAAVADEDEDEDADADTAVDTRVLLPEFGADVAVGTVMTSGAGTVMPICCTPVAAAVDDDAEEGGLLL
jgi:hypothetical protein